MGFSSNRSIYLEVNMFMRKKSILELEFEYDLVSNIRNKTKSISPNFFLRLGDKCDLEKSTAESIS